MVFEFTFDDLMRIRSWHFMTRQHHELVPRSVAIVQVCLLFIMTGVQPQLLNAAESVQLCLSL